MELSKLKAMRVSTPENQVRIIIAGRASYFNGLVATLDDDEKPDGGKSYRSGILLPQKAPKEVIQVLNTAVKDAVKLGIKTKWNGIKPSSLKLPVRNGNEKYNEDKEKYESHKDTLFMNAKKPEQQGKPLIKAYGQVVNERGIIESGDWCAWDISLYPYNHPKGGKGVGVSLNGCTLIEEGERFGGGPSAQSIEEETAKLYGDMFASDDPFAATEDEYDPLADMLS